ncbi:hypothetical protein NYE25_29650 [Paenibacillus sp. FSL E2-8871]|uniref:hypothetical protein n=1 Tax=unclassified Paenibacillus TaxID=185978 RepID=UPI0030F6207B
MDSVKSFEIQKPLPSFSINEDFQFKINNLDIDTPALPQTPMQINFKNEMDRILREKMEGKSDSNHSIKDVEVKAVEGTGKVQTGGKSDIFDPDEYLRNLDKADEMYDTFRSSTTDVASITRNTGMKDSRVQRIKEHLFIKEHIKDHGVGRFDADYDIAQAWERLQKGTYNQSDIDLLNHELFESRFEGIFKTNYRTAHDKTLESGRPWNP